MGLAKAGTIIRSGDPLAVQGVSPMGIAVSGQVIWQGGGPIWQMVDHGTAQANTATSYTLDTTGANLLVGFMAISSGGAISDNQGNTWTSAAYIGVGNPYTAMFYCIHPTTSSQHVIQVTGGYLGAWIAAFSGPNTMVFDQYTTNSSSNSEITMQLPAITPVADSLLVTAIGLNARVAAIDSDFNQVDLVARATQYGISGAYLVAPDTTPLAPTWTVSSIVYALPNPTIMLSFKPS